MKIFIQALDYNIWSVIINSPYMPTISIDGMPSPKPKKHWDEHDKRMVQLNAKVMNILYYLLDANKFNHISTYTSTKELWDRLKVIHDGINQVKEFKINIFVYKYELFKIEQNESLIKMFIRFTNIINDLKSLSKSILTVNLFEKFSSICQELGRLKSLQYKQLKILAS